MKKKNLEMPSAMAEGQSLLAVALEMVDPTGYHGQSHLRFQLPMVRNYSSYLTVILLNWCSRRPQYSVIYLVVG